MADWTALSQAAWSAFSRSRPSRRLPGTCPQGVLPIRTIASWRRKCYRSERLPDAIFDVCHGGRVDHLDGFEGGISDVLEQPLPGTEDDRNDVEI